MRSLLTLLLLALLSTLARAEWWESSKEFKDWELVEHLRDPDAVGRANAAAMLADRWSGPDYVALLKDDWQAGMEALAGGWPAKNDSPLADYLLTTTRTSAIEREDAAYALSHNLSGDRIAAFSGPIRDIALKQWCEEWALRIPRSCALPGPIWYAANSKRKWLRDFFYADGEWAKAWGWSQQFGYSWRLIEYRFVMAAFAGDPVDQKYVDERQFATALLAACKTGKNPCDIEMTDVSQQSDRLTSETRYEEFGALSYAELVCVVMDRPDWLPAVWKRLEKAKVHWSVVATDQNGKMVVEQREEVRDISTPFLRMIHQMQRGNTGEAMKLWADYKRDKWSVDEINKQALLHHPWCKAIVATPAWSEAWEKEDLPMDWSKFNDTYEGKR